MKKLTLYPQWLPYEARRIGALGFATPILAALLFVVAASAMAATGASGERVSLTLTIGTELGLSLAAGLVVVSLVTDHRAAELHRSLVTTYRATLLRRLALAVGWTALVALAWSLTLAATGGWAVPGPLAAGQLAWISPLLWFVSVGALLGLALGNRAAASAVLGAVWVFENSLGVATFLSSDWLRPFFLFATSHATGADFWFFNRLAIAAMAAALMGVAVALLGRESSVTGGEA